jgi:hypothetical protein
MTGKNLLWTGLNIYKGLLYVKGILEQFYVGRRANRSRERKGFFVELFPKVLVDRFRLSMCWGTRCWGTGGVGGRGGVGVGGRSGKFALYILAIF